MKIYFAGSIRGGRNDKELYFLLIKHLTEYGQVLTEHVGNDNLTKSGENNLSDKQIFYRDMHWLEEADVVVSEVSVPSLGVGYEIAKAEEMGKQILCLYREQQGKALSALINGNPNLRVVRYRDLNEAINHIEEFFRALEK